MSAPQSPAKILSLAVLVIAAAWGAWYLLTPATYLAPARVTAESMPVPANPPALSPPAGAAATAATETAVAAAAPQAPAQPDPVVLAAADQHQNGKIARGLSEHGGSGLLVNAAPPGSVTEQLRLQPGDIVVTVNGEPVASIDDFVRIYRSQGTPTQLTILREGREVHLH